MNLYTSALGQIPFEAIEAFLGLNLPIEQRIPEGPRIDYKLQITQDIGDDVASLANTDGGLIFIGVISDKTKQNVPVDWPGMPARQDYATQITSKILSTVRPRPDFDIGWAPTSTGNYIFVVRVRAGNHPPYEYAQGNTIRIPIRVHDGKRSASVRDIEALFQRRASASGNPEKALTSYLNASDFDPKIGATADHAEICYDYQRFVVAPVARAEVRLDSRFESNFEHAVFRHFIDVLRKWDHKVRGDYFQVESRKVGQFPYHFLWRIYRTGTLALTASIAGDFPEETIAQAPAPTVPGHLPVAKPIGDLASNLLSMCSLASEVFNDLGIYGDLHLGHLLRAPNVRFNAKFPLAGRDGRYEYVLGLEIPTPQSAIVDRTSTFYGVDSSELQSPSEVISEILTYSLRETRGIRFDRERLVGAVAHLDRYLRGARKNVR
jgi:hypothetical protein